MNINKVQVALHQYGSLEIDELLDLFELLVLEDENLPKKNDALLINMNYLYVRKGLDSSYKKFLILHELGHYIMHYDENINFHFSIKVRKTKVEKEANTFACMYLLQNETMEDINVIHLLRGKGVPHQIAIRFCEDMQAEKRIEATI